MRRWWLALMVVWHSAGAVPVGYVDLSDAYQQSTALADLIVQVDAQVASLRGAFEKQRQPLLDELEALKTTKMHADAQLARKRELLLALAELEATSAKQQQVLGKANAQATARVDREIEAVEAELKAEYGLVAIFRTQDLLYQRAGNGLDLGAELYRRLNQRLPKVDLNTASP